MIYLASPYSHKKKYNRLYRFLAACRHAAEMMQAGALVYSPIAHGHPIATASDSLGTDFNAWARHNRAMLYACESLHVLKIDGWEDSDGVKNEIEIAQERGIKIEFSNPSEITSKLAKGLTK